MSRTLCFWAGVVLAASSTFGEEWADKMFKVRHHDWGTVARSSKTEFAFEFTNLYREDIHVADVRPSCGCTSVSVIKDTVKTGETGVILAKFNTHTHSGSGSATLTVTIDRPQYAEVTLTVKGYIRTDVTLEPGGIEFGDVDQGSSQSRSLTVSFQGASDLKVMSAKSENSNLRIETAPVKHQFGESAFRVTVQLGENAPAGYLNEQVVVQTSDGRTTPVPVRGRVVAPLAVSPSSFFIGVVKPGEMVSKQIVVRGKQPFKVMKVTCGDDRFEFKTTDEERTVHTIPVLFHANDKLEKITQTIEVQTNLGGQMSATCQATVKIAEK